LCPRACEQHKTQNNDDNYDGDDNDDDNGEGDCPFCTSDKITIKKGLKK
jgi:hypothetical protein